MIHIPHLTESASVISFDIYNQLSFVYYNLQTLLNENSISLSSPILVGKMEGNDNIDIYMGTAFIRV